MKREVGEGQVAGVDHRIRRFAIDHAAFTKTLQARPPERESFGATSRSLTLRPGDSLTILTMALSVGFRIPDFPKDPVTRATGSDSYPGGTDSH